MHKKRFKKVYLVFGIIPEEISVSFLLFASQKKRKIATQEKNIITN